MPIKYGKEKNMADYYGIDFDQVNNQATAFVRGYCYGAGLDYEVSQNGNYIHFEIQFATPQDAAKLGCKLIYIGYPEAGEFLVKQAVVKQAVAKKGNR